MPRFAIGEELEDDLKLDDKCSPESIRAAVLDIVRSVAPETATGGIPNDRELRTAIDLDSMDWLNVVAGLEERFCVEIPACDHAGLSTVDAIVEYLAARLPRRNGSPAPMQPRPAALPSATLVIDGIPVTMRPMRDDDMALEASFVRHLSSESRYLRFMATLKELPPRKLDYLTHVDQDRHVALVAVVQCDSAPRLAGVVRYIVDASGTGCEFAIAVDDAWHGTGLAGILMYTLMSIARSRGLVTMEGLVLRANDKMLKLARQLGFRLERRPDDPVSVRVVRSLR
jgi:acetyltransferase